jgi:23S rRNA pseudouridine955/2504/2580 synthase
VRDDGLAARTDVRVLERDGLGRARVACVLRTGRTHQIRVHLAGAGHPIAGDDKYGDFELNRQLQKGAPQAMLERMFLHAWRLSFTHPSTGKRVHLTAPLPAALQGLIDHVPSTEL